MTKTSPNNPLPGWSNFWPLILLLVFSQCSKNESDTVPPVITVTDIDGNSYKTVKIGNQTWMAENLRVTRYRNGDLLNYTPEEWYWGGDNGAYCYYLNDNNLALTYGCLYNWWAISDPRNIAPVGWHVPTEEEWNSLIAYLGGSDVAGGKMKEAGMVHWSTCNTGATNSSGFTALPGGCRDKDCHYGEMTSSAYFWSSTQYTYGIRVYGIYNCQEVVQPMLFSSIFGLSIRCIKD